MMVNNNKKSIGENALIFMSFFISVIAYVKDFNLASIKYIGILVTIAIVIKNLNGIIEKRRAIVSLIVLTILISSCLFQDTTILQKMISIGFYFVLVFWLFFGEKIFRNTGSIKSALFGITSATFLGIMLTWSDRSMQLSNYFNSRSRVWWGFTHANTLGSIAECMIIGALCVLFINKGIIGRKKKVFYYVCLILAGVYLLQVTDSRTAMISVIALVFVMGTSLLKKVDAVTRFFLVLFFVLLVCIISYKFLTGYALTDEAFTARLNAFSDMKVNPLTFFVGNGMVDTSELNMANANGGHGEIALVQLFYKNGILGVIAYILIFGYLFLRINQIKSSRRRKLSNAVIIALLVGSIGEAFLVNITNVLPMFLFILLSSLIFGDYDSDDIQAGSANKVIGD